MSYRVSLRAFWWKWTVLLRHRTVCTSDECTFWRHISFRMTWCRLLYDWWLHNIGCHGNSINQVSLEGEHAKHIQRVSLKFTSAEWWCSHDVRKSLYQRNMLNFSNIFNLREYDMCSCLLNKYLKGYILVYINYIYICITLIQFDWLFELH